MIEDDLRALAATIDVPPAPDLTARVHARITRPKPRNRLLVMVLALLTAFGIAVAVSPAVRAGVVEILRFAGIEFRSQAPPSTAPPITGEREASLADARKLVPFDVHVPPAFANPDKVTVYEGRFISLSANGMRLDQFDGTIDSTLAKIVGQQDVEQLPDGRIWIPRPHEVFYIDRRGEWHREPEQGTGKTLIWQRDAVTFRLSGDFTKEQALEISAS
ncbi:hypothetical protein Lesp02_66710 [Lentzea sp. NBRC 105346]|uniref:hypothetical protein n=1 Tax=Lentzea sp. NBRC 105346 TaxID=3032205 RepID=UPI0024A4E508|nr:hypothetical protein [Lentzea sp. NBRC 105346]GLZ34484.1 hypothetical protein Lesp02_66710 [Lentzea sp. NBRC 105346]